MAMAQPRTTSKNRKKTAHKSKTIASQADKYFCYQQSVQDPPFEVRILKRTYRDIFGKNPRTLREDFCGAGAVACEWVKQKDAEAWGVDFDPEPIAWGANHNYSLLKPAQQERVNFIEGDVRDAKSPKVDIVCAQNFSYYIFKTRKELLDYFKFARSHLNKDGVFVVDMLGGPNVQEDEEEEEREIDDEDFTYVWEQARFNPINHSALFHIHFDFEDGSRLKKAFTYDWRLWTIPEVREIMAEAGFSDTTVYWEKSDEDGDGNGVFYKTENAPADLTWLCYIAAKR